MAQPVIRVSRYPFADTVTRLGSEISKAGATIFCTLDQSAAAKSVGLELRPTTLLIFGNPSAGTHLMQAFPRTGLDLPLKLLIWEEQGTVHVAYTPASSIAERYGMTDLSTVISAMDQQLDRLTSTVAVDGSP